MCSMAERKQTTDQEMRGNGKNENPINKTDKQQQPEENYGMDAIWR